MSHSRVHINDIVAPPADSPPPGRVVHHFSRLQKLVAAHRAAERNATATGIGGGEQAYWRHLAADAHQAIMSYRSRGHGRGGISPRFGRSRGKYLPHQGKQECARRARQIAACPWRYEYMEVTE